MNSASPLADQLDHRRNAIRPDLADARLAGIAQAAAFSEGERMQVITHVAPVHRQPRKDSGLDTEALCGDTVRVFEITEGWAWVQLERDAYVGYLPVDRLGPASPPPTHRVLTVRTFAYPGPSMKLPRAMTLPFGGRVHVLRHHGDFAVVSGVAGLAESFVWAAHLAEVGHVETDWVAAAERLVGVPYLWGGRSTAGLDCSGLTQLALDAGGITAPRDSDMQEAELGHPVMVDDPLSGLLRGDLVFWRGHVGIMQDGHLLLHANGHHMLVASEPLATATARILAKGGGPITSIKRL